MTKRRFIFNSEQVIYTLGGLENLQTARKYYASTIDLTGGRSTRALFGICLLTKGRSKEDKESSELQSLAAMALENDDKSSIGQLTKGRSKEDKESSELQPLSAMALEIDFN
ncbi:hypothetical protein HAX54_031459 [Datura stramonium]|uniref:ER membrane protein complex subunit 2 n=1 Tax=Datura stramonium TaxID=4076 RepID=A0ABS8SC72_DATST|nr:hypothetical protein [Datura stramonium]